MWNNSGWRQENGWYRNQVASGPVTFAYVTSSRTLGSASASQVDWTSVPIGTASATRRVVFVWGGTGTSNGPAVSATIGGVAAVIHTDQSGPGSAFTSIISAVVPTGTTANITVIYTGLQFFNFFGNAYTIDNSTLISTTPLTSTGTATSSTSVVGSSVLATSGGVVIGAASFDAGVSSFSASPYTIDDATIQQWFSGSVGSTGSITPTGTWASSTANSAISATVWR